MNTSNTDTQFEESATEVLPPAGSQFLYDYGYKAGEFLKRNVIAMTIGFSLGLLVCYAINNRKSK